MITIKINEGTYTPTTSDSMKLYHWNVAIGGPQAAKPVGSTTKRRWGKNVCACETHSQKRQREIKVYRQIVRLCGVVK